MSYKAFQDYRRRDPVDFLRFFDDFVSYVAADWTITTTEAGTGAATEALTPHPGGALLVSNDNADDDADFFQKPGESFKYVAGKKLFFRIRFKLSDVTDSDFVAGLQITDTTPLAVTDGIYFRKLDADTTPDLVVVKDSTETVVAMEALTNDTWVELAFYYDGSVLKAYVDGVAVGGQIALTNAPDDEDLTVSFGIQNGAAAIKTLTVDYIEAVVER